MELNGIDVSKWNGVIQWPAVAASGIRFAMIRAAYGAKTGGATLDPRFPANIAGATAAGISAGVYLYSYALSVREAISEADALIRLLEPYRAQITFPVACDIEELTQAVLGRTVLTRMANAFADRIRAAGYTPLIYSNLNWLTNFFTPADFTADVWLAQWAKKPSYTGSYVMWQRTDRGSVPGITGNVDLNIAYVDFAADTSAQAVDRLYRAGRINSPDYWKAVVEGKSAASAQNVAALLDKWAASLPDTPAQDPTLKKGKCP